MGALTYYLENHGQLIMLTPGTILVGRGIECGIRFNDMSVSRRHLVLRVSDHDATAEDAGSTNGTRINGQRLSGIKQLKHGDMLQIGRRFVRIELQAESDADSLTPAAGLPGLNRVIIAAPAAGDDFSIGEQSRTCPRCRAMREANDAICSNCGYHWKRRDLAVTQDIGNSLAERRLEPRVGVSIPILYESEVMELEARATDLSRGGLFIESDLLDPVGTECSLLLLPDGQPAIAIEGHVCHVRRGAAGGPDEDDEESAAGDADEAPPPYVTAGNPGMGIRFTRISEAALRWIAQALTATGQLQPAGATPPPVPWHAADQRNTAPNLPDLGVRIKAATDDRVARVLGPSLAPAGRRDARGSRSALSPAF